MKNIKLKLAYVFFAVVLVITVVLIFVFTKNVKIAEGTVAYNMYYINGSTNTLEEEKRVVNMVNDDTLMFNTVVDEFASGPKNSNQGLMLPPKFKITDKRHKDNTAYIDLAGSYNSLEPNLKVLCTGALVYTLTDLSFIDDVVISVDGAPLKDSSGNTSIFNRNNVKNNPSIDPDKTDRQTVKLYFADNTGTKLVAEERSIEVKQSLTLENQIVEQLIAGPERNSLNPTIPSSTSIKDIKTEEGICYVNLTQAFIRNNSPLPSERITIYSIVNSLTELDTVNKVQFLIEGEKINEYKGDIDFSKPFERDESLIR